MNRIITLLVFCCVSFNSIADELKLQKDHPERYVVVKGDTLWGISAKFLKDPWQWPKIWKMNRAEIKNPHWIYPGDVVVLDMSSGSPQLRLLHETITLQPGVVVEPLDKSPIQTIATNIIGPFLSQPLLIENGQLDAAPRIIAGQDDRVIFSPNSRIYISNLVESEGLNWFVYRPGEALIDPETKKSIGTEAIYLGDARITKFGTPSSGMITKAKEEIFTKDRLVSAPDLVQSNFIPHAPDTNIKGRIIKIYGGVGEAGPSSVVSINRGSLDGLETGHVLAISRYGRIVKDPEYKAPDTTKVTTEKPKLAELNFDVSRDKDGKAIVNFAKDRSANSSEQSASALKLEPGQIKLPDERVGLLMVFKTFDHVSYALIMEATDAVYTLDTVITP